MTSRFKIIKNICLAFMLFMSLSSAFSQGDTSTIKMQFALGINSPFANGFVDDFEAKTINFPTINIGLQYMFNQKLGAKLDFGYNRFSNLENTPDFKINYTRLNLQLVYNANKMFGFSRRRLGAFLHAGPGISMIGPLGNYTENKTSFLNANGGIEFHYGLSDKLSVYIDASYILGFAKDFSPITDGFGSFNGNIVAVTIGASISLSGCYYCDQ